MAEFQSLFFCVLLLQNSTSISKAYIRSLLLKKKKRYHIEIRHDISHEFSKQEAVKAYFAAKEQSTLDSGNIRSYISIPSCIKLLKLLYYMNGNGQFQRPNMATALIFFLTRTQLTF